MLYNGGSGRTDNPSSGLVSWWKFNNVSGSTVTDSAGSNIGTLINSATWSTGSPIKQANSNWSGTSDGSGGGAVTDVSLNTDRYVTSYTTSSTTMPSNNISSLAMGSGGLALVGTSDAGAWNAAVAGFPVDDTAVNAATIFSNVRLEGGTRLKRGVRLK